MAGRDLSPYSPAGTGIEPGGDPMNGGDPSTQRGVIDGIVPVRGALLQIRRSSEARRGSPPCFSACTAR